MTVDIVVQARSGSSRLPGKVLSNANGWPLLGHLLGRLSFVQLAGRLIVGTTTAPEDDAIETLVAGYSARCFRWPPGQRNLLEGFLWASEQSDAIVRVTADCPLIDPATVDMLIARYLMGDVDHVEPSGMPDGTWCEVVSRSTLERINTCTDLTDEEREHVTLYARRRPSEFRLGFVDTRLGMQDERWDVNEPDDLALVRRVIESLPAGFTFGDVCRLMAQHPDWSSPTAGRPRAEAEERLYAGRLH